MDKILAVKKRKRATVICITLLLLTTICSFLVVFAYAKKECMNTLRSAAVFANEELHAMIDANEESLQSIASFVDRDNPMKDPVYMDYLRMQKIGAMEAPIRLYLDTGVILEEHGLYNGMQKLIPFESVASNKPYLSGVHEDPFVAGRQIIEHFYPVMRDKQVIGMVSAVIDISRLKDVVPCVAYDGKSDMMLVDRRDGTIVFDTMRSREDASFSDAKPFPEFFEKVMAGEETYTRIDGFLAGPSYFLYASPSSLYDFSTIVVAEESIVVGLIRDLNIFLSCILLVELLFIVIYVIVVSRISRKEMRSAGRRFEAELAYANHIANIDELTNVKNKHAFVEIKDLLLEEMHKDAGRRSAVVVCDVNNLKLSNDLYGHEAGDELIRSACKIICREFKYSPVFRIGGDEFAVLLGSRDFENREQLVAEFKSHMEENKRNGSIVIAIGMAEILMPTMDGINEALQKADAAMYAHKQELKKTE